MTIRDWAQRECEIDDACNALCALRVRTIAENKPGAVDKVWKIERAWNRLDARLNAIDKAFPLCAV